MTCEFRLSQLFTGKFYPGPFVSLNLGLLIYEVENIILH